MSIYNCSPACHRSYSLYLYPVPLSPDSRWLMALIYIWTRSPPPFCSPLLRSPPPGGCGAAPWPPDGSWSPSAAGLELGGGVRSVPPPLNFKGSPAAAPGSGMRVGGRKEQKRIKNTYIFLQMGVDGYWLRMEKDIWRKKLYMYIHTYVHIHICTYTYM